MAPRGTFCGRLKYHNRYVARDIGQASAWHLAARDPIHTKATLQLRAAAAMATARRRSGRGEGHRGIMIQFRTQKKANLCLHGDVHPGYLKASRAQEAFRSEIDSSTSDSGIHQKHTIILLLAPDYSCLRNGNRKRSFASSGEGSVSLGLANSYAAIHFKSEVD